MKKLTMIFGAQVPTFFTTEGGVSISEIARRQAEAKQKNDIFWGKVNDAVSGVFRKIVSFIGPGNSSPQTLQTVTISIGTLQECVDVGNRNAETATLMHGLKLFKTLQSELQEACVSLQEFVGPLPEFPKTPEYPLAPAKPSPVQSCTVCSTTQFMDLTNFDEIIVNLKPSVLAQFGFAFWKKANEQNARAAAIGRLISEQGSFFREIAKPLPKGGEQLTQTGVVISQWERAYSTEELDKFAALRDRLQLEYNDLQKDLNWSRKQIKDAVRAYNMEEERRYQAEYGDFQIAYASHEVVMKEIRARHSEDIARHAREMECIRSSAETLRQEALAELASLRVRTE